MDKRFCLVCRLLLKAILVGAATGGATGAFGQSITYDTTTSILTLPSVQIGSARYNNVTLQNTGNYTFVLKTYTAATPTGTALSSYDSSSGVLTVPSVTVGSATYAATLTNIGNFTFKLQTATPVDSYIYYSKNSTLPQIATYANGTLNMDGLKITNFSFGGSASDATGTLTRWATPSGNNWNQPNVEVMFFCGTDNKLAYVLLLPAAQDPNRGDSTVPNMLSAIDATSNDSKGIYTDCSGGFTASWNNNLPFSDFWRYPDTLTNYDYAYVANQVNGAAVYFESGTGKANAGNYLAITWQSTGAPSFQVWK